MDFSLTKEQTELRNKAINFAKQKLNLDIIEQDALSEFPRQKWLACAQFGLQGLIIPQQYCGLGLDILSAVLVMEGLGYGCKDNGLLLSINVTIWNCEIPILHFGTEAQKQKYLPGLCNGSLIGAYGMTEPESGSDAFSLRTTAVRVEDGYVLNGTKTLITNAPVADLVVTFAKIPQQNEKDKISCFIVEKENAGLSLSKKIDKMGLRTSPFGEVVFQDCFVAGENLLGKEGQGQAIFNDALAEERAFILASQVGAMERQLGECINYAKARRQFNKKIFDFQSVSNMLADMKVRLETSRLLVYKVAWLRQQKKRAFMEASMAKLYISECCIQNSISAVRIHGGYGYTTEFEHERQLRDALGGVLYSGTSEIQRNIIAELLD
jgi:alkylation response protein AidB-like acyl-CoA dehydrogenase